VRGEVADMVILTTERVIGHELDRDGHEHLISEALDSLETEVAGETR
jgi:F-type H+-transporting ATPase subunit b